MKNMSVFLVVLLALCLVLPASSQVNLGVLGGLNLANYSIDPAHEGTDWSNRTAFGFGVVLDFNLIEPVALLLEPMYLQKGTKTDWEETSEIEFISAYLEIPVMLKYTFATSKIKPYVIAGPSIGYNLSAQIKASGGGESREDDEKKYYKSLDFSLGFGAGVNVPMGNNSIFVEARYTLGLTNISDDPYHKEKDIKTKGIQIFTGITFPLGRK